ncbi:hypothetical protein [Actinopolymorpha pittospori]
MTGPDTPGRTTSTPDIPDSDIPEPGFIPSEDDELGLPDSDIPDVPADSEPDEVILEPDVEKARDLTGETGYEMLGTDELLPESETTEFEPPDRLSADTLHRRTAEEEERGETLDERLAEEEPDPALSYDEFDEN